MNPLQRALIEKVGHDHGFEHVLASDPAGVVLASARHATSAKVVASPTGGYVLHLLAEEPSLLPEMCRTFPHHCQAGSFAAVSEAGLATLLRRAADLTRALPSQAAQDYQASVVAHLAQLPAGLGGTEVERLVRQRVGQQKFREAMLDYWGGACAVTGLALPEVLRASHAKPWSECDSDAERLDVFNGFLLVANLDALFDRFLISFDNNRRILVSSRIGHTDLACLGLASDMTLRWLTDAHMTYLTWHRARCEDATSLPV
ncbi:HNH endonuclease [Aquitalea sp. ASV11]|uniref:HNH endonuclease n=1 Tax=Aquitalea sp. ASV11 TaxID=2795103 RepID=UPI0018EE0723|nr:HNH endonuclease [Aquitalea sp. ASV11]MBX9348489.1 HNH endonuclease [Chromobacterium vaccinii]